MPIRRRKVLLSTTALLSLDALPATAAAATPLPLEEASIATLSAGMAAGRTTALALVQAYNARIDAIDLRGPQLNSVIERNPDAAAIAQALDAERKAGKLRGPLHGVPVLLKDNIATGDRMRTSAGSLALADVRAVRDAHLVKRLRDAGAVIIGKTNLSEWANIRSTRSTSGWSARGGLTRNPYALDRNTSGSSSGTGAAIAASLAAVGVGTETNGSIVSPASICGLVGLKPTVGRISRDGVIPISHTQDTAGPMARTVADASLLYAAMAGPDAADASTTTAAAAAAATTADGPQARSDLKGLRLGVARAYFTGHDEADALIEQAIARLAALGAEIVADCELQRGTYGAAELTLLLYELKADLPLWLHNFAPQAPVQTLADVIAFNNAHAAQEMPWFKQELFERAQALGGLDSPRYAEVLATCATGARTDGLDRAFARHRLDAIIAPTGGLAWLTDPVNGDAQGASFSSPAAVAGYPHLTVPAGLVQGLPLGLSFVGKPFTEWQLLGIGQVFEQATRHRRAPRYAAHAAV